MSDLFSFPDGVSVGHVVYPPGGVLGPRMQTNLQLVLLHSGSMTIWVDAEPMPVAAHSVTLLLPNHREYFNFAPNEQTEHSWLHIPAATLSPRLLDQLRGLPRQIPLSSDMSGLMQDALRYAQSTLSTTSIILRGFGMQMIALYIAESEFQPGGRASAPVNTALAEARGYIHRHYMHDIALSDIARAAAVSETHLIRLFRQHLGTTPMAYLWEHRVWAGIELLRRTGLSVGEIALRVGFKTSYHFSRRIRLATGFTPMELRQQSWG